MGKIVFIVMVILIVCVGLIASGILDRKPDTNSKNYYLPEKMKVKEVILDVSYQTILVIEYDGCEYIATKDHFGDFTFTLKGNCKQK